MAHSNTITNENLSDLEKLTKEEEIKKTPKKPSSLLKKRIDERTIGTSLDTTLFGVKVEAGRNLIKNDDECDLSDSDNDEDIPPPPCLPRSHKTFELNTEYLDIRADSESVEVELDTDLIDAVITAEKKKKKKFERFNIEYAQNKAKERAAQKDGCRLRGRSKIGANQANENRESTTASF